MDIRKFLLFVIVALSMLYVILLIHYSTKREQEKMDARTVKIKYFDKDYPRLELVDGKSDWIDLRAAERIRLHPNTHYLIPLGVAMQLSEGYEAWIVPRSSSFAKWGILQTNSPGIIDETYCGNDDQWFMSVYATRYETIEKYDRICQFRLVKHQDAIPFSEVEMLENENRDGHGSTGDR